MGTLRDPSTINNVGTLGGATNPTTAQALPLERENQKAIRELVGTFGYEALTISAGGITPTKAEVTVDTEAGASTDDLTTIYLVSDGTTTLHDGMLLKLRAYDPARVVTVKHGSGINQIQTVSRTDIVLGTDWELTLKLQSGVWKEVRGRQDITGNAATASDMAAGHVLAGKTTAEAVRGAIEAPSPNVGKFSSVEVTHATGQPLANNVAASVLTTSTANGPLNVSHLSGQAGWRITEGGTYRVEIDLPVLSNGAAYATLSVIRVRSGVEAALYTGLDGLSNQEWRALKVARVGDFDANDDVVFKVLLVGATGTIHSAYGRATITKLR